MAKTDGGKTSNLTPSWQSGSLNTDPISTEGLNSAMRGDIAANYLKGPTQQSYVGMGGGTSDALANLTQQAYNQRGLLSDAITFNRDTIAGGGLNGPQRGALSGMQDIAAAGGYNDAMRSALSGYQGIASAQGLTGDQRDAMGYLRSVMNGTGTAPGYETLRANAIDDARTAVNQQFGASGRFGAGSHVSDLGRGITDAAAGLDYRSYEADLARKAAAAGGLFNMGQTGQGNLFGALSGIGGLGQGALGNVMNANTGIFNMGQAGQNNMANAANSLPSLYDAFLTPERIAVAQQSALDADRQGAAAFDPYLNHLANYQGLLGSNSGAPQPEQPFNWRDGMGIGLGLLSAFL